MKNLHAWGSFEQREKLGPWFQPCVWERPDGTLVQACTVTDTAERPEEIKWKDLYYIGEVVRCVRNSTNRP